MSETEGSAGADSAGRESASSPLLVVIGPPGAGKSLVGKLTARLLHVPFIDTDRRIVKQHGAIPAIFTDRGEQSFRVLERIEVRKALTERAVVALGGGAVLHPDTQAELMRARVALITVSADAVTSRIRGTVRPLLRDGIESWQSIMNDRREIYERLATRTVDSSQRSAPSIAHELAEWVAQEEKL